MRLNGEEKSFPSPLETIAASALLLLTEADDDATAAAAAPPPSSEPCLDVIPAKYVRDHSTPSSESSGSKSYSSSLTSSVSSTGSHSRKIRVITARLRGKLQVSQRARSKVSFISKLSPRSNDSIMSGTLSMKPTLSSRSTSSSRTLAEPRSLAEINKNTEAAYGKQHIRSSHISLRAEAILKLLSEGSAHETRIRKELGDSPDTSKALRTFRTKVGLLVFLQTAQAGRGQAIGERWASQSIYLHDCAKGVAHFSRLK